MQAPAKHELKHTLTIISSRAMCGTSVRLVIFATKMTLYTCKSETCMFKFA